MQKSKVQRKRVGKQTLRSSAPASRAIARGKSSMGFSRQVSAPVSSTNVYTAPMKAANQVISHREFVSDIVSSATAGAFSSTVFSINPGNASLFPWLSQIAQSYEEYEILKMRFIFRKVAPSTTQGLILMAAQYDSYDAAFTTKAEMMDYAGASSTAVWNDLIFDLDCKNVHQRQKLLYVLPTGDSPSGDEREYYAGNFSVATSNLSDVSVNIGELLVEYSIRFSKPLLSQVSGAGPSLEEEAQSSTAFTPTSAAALMPGAVSIDFNSGAPFDFSSGSSGYNSVFSAAGLTGLVKPNKWLMSTLWEGKSSTDPTFTAATSLVGAASAVITDITGITFPVYSSDSEEATDVRHFLMDFSGVDDTTVSRLLGLVSAYGPTFSVSGGFYTSSGFAAALVSKITSRAYNNLINPSPGAVSLSRCPVLRHICRLPLRGRGRQVAVENWVSMSAARLKQSPQKLSLRLSFSCSRVVSTRAEEKKKFSPATGNSDEKDASREPSRLSAVKDQNHDAILRNELLHDFVVVGQPASSDTTRSGRPVATGPTQLRR